MRWWLLVVVVLSVFTTVHGGAIKWMSVFRDGPRNTYRLAEGADLSAIAYGRYEDNLETNGWGRLYIQSNPTSPDEEQMYAAGMLEGALTAHRIYPHFLNINTFFFGNSSAAVPTVLKNWLNAQDKWARANAAAKNATDPYWGLVGGVLAQFDGLVAGYQAVAPKNETLPAMAFTILNGVGDLLDLKSAFIDPEWKKHINPNWIFNTHCSALVKLTGDMSELYTGHTSWFLYSSMSRIAKEYNLLLKNKLAVSKRVIFSSYPAFLESLDDFYITDQKLVVSETSLSIFNKELYSIVRANSNVLLSWQRTLVSNRMSTTGAQWANTYSKYASGTYNNQWLVIDYKQFVPQLEVKNGTLTILEQIPGKIVWDDMTDQLVKGYWPSYNVPYFSPIFDAAGYIEASQTDQIMASYQTCCRANIFRREQGKVDDLDSFKTVLRYNHWQTDPYSQGDPGYSISSRFDLDRIPSMNGGIDTKVTSASHVPFLAFEAINGPTYESQPVFSWAPYEDRPHAGLPTTYDFPFVLHKSLAP
eukprot:TRINITY_DN6372_c0_g2_i1.p1 TRINITY_DN6372_c0_g2~~TRINITY_DN6372_c0_g2_i1.p1  ORF type:complete len:537 (+),score=65.67 TRINITY_DN6372_c0_g2_i1:23-1612(+)